ncbi:hypothetical protein SAMN02910456_02618 [Ruminococcaceae bacterium YRB3002]|nr:hypothetical protein SAMN02910456_02618 [Ruminococcaceae bacterium YRB3002]
MGDNIKMKTGKIGENLAFNAFLKNDFEVYPSLVDDNGIDCIVHYSGEKVFYIQVKTCHNNNYQFVNKKAFHNGIPFYVCFIRLDDNDEVLSMHLIPSSAWNKDSIAFRFRPYDKDSNSSDPEYEINYTGNTKEDFEQYTFDKMVKELQRIAEEK